MKFKIYQFRVQTIKKLIALWYWLMAPIAWIILTLEDRLKKYEQNKITYEKTVRWTAEDIIRYTLTNKYGVDLLVCKWANEDHFWADCQIDASACYIDRKKTKTALIKMPIHTIEFSKHVIEHIKKLDVVDTLERVEEFPEWQRIDDYHKSVSFRRRK